MTGQRHLDGRQCLSVSWGHIVFRASGACLVCDFSIVTTGRTVAVASTAALGRPSASGLIGRAISWPIPTALRSAAPKLAATSSKRMLGAPALSVLGNRQLRWGGPDLPGQALAQLGQFDAARAVYERELSVAEAAVGPEHRFAREARARLGSPLSRIDRDSVTIES